jgi:hypothetical protein
MELLDVRHARGWHQFSQHAQARQVEEAANQAVRRVHPNYPPLAFPPPVFNAAFTDALAQTAEQLIHIVQAIPERLFGGSVDRWMTWLGLDERTTRLMRDLATPRAMQLATTFARPDLLPTRTGFKAVEINVSPYLGVGFSGRVTELQESSPYFDFLRKLGTLPRTPDMAGMWRHAIASITRVRPADRRPTFFLAGAQFSDDFTQDFGLPDFERLMRSCGYDFLKGHMKALQLQHDGVFFEGRRIDAVFAGITFQEMLRDGVPESLILGLHHADECMLADFICAPVNALFENKLTLELLSSDEFAHCFTPQEQSLLKRCIPRTCRIGRTNLTATISGKDSYVLKPACEYGGEGVVIGMQSSPAEWRACVEQAAASPNGYLVQEVVDDVQTYPDLQDETGRRSIAVCLGPMVFGGRYGGTMLRQLPFHGRPGVINASTGAHVGVAFSVDPVPDERQ